MTRCRDTGWVLPNLVRIQKHREAGINQVTDNCWQVLYKILLRNMNYIFRVWSHLHEAQSGWPTGWLIEIGVQPLRPQASTGWSEIRPMIGSTWDSNNFQPSGLPTWSTSGSLNSTALSPSSQPSVWNVIVPQYQILPHPVPQGGSPAYCFHCMQYGAVSTIIPAETYDLWTFVKNFLW